MERDTIGANYGPQFLRPTKDWKWNSSQLLKSFHFRHRAASAAALNKLGIPTKTGTSWSPQAVGRF